MDDSEKFTIKNKQRSPLQMMAVVAILLVFAVIAIAFAVAAMGFIKEGEPSPFGSDGISSSGGKGCYLTDESFRDISTVGNSDYVYNKIGSKYPALNNDKNKSNVAKIISSSINEKVNPAVLLSFYFGEQTFNQKNDYKAFGCGKFSGKDKGIDNQLKCALPLIDYAIEKKIGGSGVDYGKPAGANIWDRLLYNYVSAARASSFKKYGYTTDDKEARIQLLRDLVPEQVECASQTTGGTGDKQASFFNKSKWQTKWLTATKTGVAEPKRITGKMDPVSGVVLHYTAGSDVNSAVSHMGNVTGCYVHLIVDENGTVYQLIPLDSKVTCGSEKGNSFAIGIEIVGLNEKDILSRPKQIDAVVSTVKYLEGAYNIPNVQGNEANLEAHRGIFGHYQVTQQGKIDPGKEYMKLIWEKLGAKES